MIDLLARRDPRRAAMLLVSIGAVGCAKLNADYAPADSATSGASVDVTTESMVDGVTSNVSTSDRPPSNTSDDEPEPPTDASATGDETGGGKGPDESSGGEEGSSTGTAPVWNPSCALGLEDELCPGTINVGPDLTCGLGPFVADDENDCDRSHTAAVQLDLEPGIYVFGTLPALGAQLFIEDGQAPQACVSSFAGLAVDEPTLLEVFVRTNTEVVDPCAVRDATDLCGVPSDCCEPAKVGAADACSDAGLWGCVSVLDPFCADTWDLLCVQTAMLFCGADCEQAIQTGR